MLRIRLSSGCNSGHQSAFWLVWKAACLPTPVGCRAQNPINGVRAVIRRGRRRRLPSADVDVREAIREETTLAPVPLSAAPEVNRLLARAGLGTLRPDDVVALPGRNDNWSGPTTGGHHVFVKRIGGPAREARRRVERALAFERLACRRPPDDLLWQPCPGWDEDDRHCGRRVRRGGPGAAGGRPGGTGGRLRHRAGRAAALRPPAGGDRARGAAAGDGADRRAGRGRGHHVAGARRLSAGRAGAGAGGGGAGTGAGGAQGGVGFARGAHPARP
ncbi:protein of unknown function (plasmid) [Streptantibioticus cattleyicolor NRRL 8057 = DSM 46488]|nr:protein of unknown function [Streptantibioticus cattleyicolor NRRL 8057 = DSM 46488]